MSHDLVSAGGASLRTHLNAGGAQQLIRDDGYDHVVLQEQSTLPVKNPGRMTACSPSAGRPGTFHRADGLRSRVETRLPLFHSL
jgi:hypothetical protein